MFFSNLYERFPYVAKTIENYLLYTVGTEATDRSAYAPGIRAF